MIRPAALSTDNKQSQWDGTMWRNYIVVAWRNLMRQKGYTLLNILGLALGLSAGVLLLSHLLVDLTWDRHHEHADHIVRVIETLDEGGSEPLHVSMTMPPLAPMLQRDLPEVEMAARVMDSSRRLVFRRGEARLHQRVVYVDSSYFEMFDFELLRGDPDRVFGRRDAVALTETAAAKYFSPGEDPLGQHIRVNNQFDVVVTAVLADPPVSTQFQFDVLLPLAQAERTEDFSLSGWNQNSLDTWLLLATGADRTALDRKINERYRYLGGGWRNIGFYTQPLADIHLHSGHIRVDSSIGKSLAGIAWTSGLIAAIILLLAGINFVNLATARAAGRAREVGLRKAAGASRRQLVVQFLSEALLTSLAAMLLAGLFVEVAAPWFNDLAGRDMDIRIFSGGPESLLLVALGVLLGLVSGIYPALLLASLRPVAVMRQQDSRVAGGGGSMRRALVILQFAISTGLIIATGASWAQLRYSLNRPMGFDKKNVLVLSVDNPQFWEQFGDHLTALRRVPGVVAATACSTVPGTGGYSSGFRPEGSERMRSLNETMLAGDALDVFGWELVEGRWFEQPVDFQQVPHQDMVGEMVINQSAARQFGWDDPLGKVVYGYGMLPFRVIGVLQDYHYYTLRWRIAPMVYFNWVDDGRYIALRYDREDVSAFVQDVREVWTARLPHLPFDWFFLDQNFDSMFRMERRTTGLLQLFSGIAVLIALLGVVGLAAYTTSRRTREIAIRNVLGAGPMRILALFTSEITLLVLIANAVAWPMAWWVMEDWYTGYAYRVPWPWWVFPAAGLGTLCIAIGTVALIAWRAAQVRPGPSLRQE